LSKEVNPRRWPKEEGVQAEIGERGDRWRQHDWKNEAASYDMPQPPDDFQPIERPQPLSFFEELKDAGLQVIVKLANIHLTPDKATYNGGSWHMKDNS